MALNEQALKTQNIIMALNEQSVKASEYCSDIT